MAQLFKNDFLTRRREIYVKQQTEIAHETRPTTSNPLDVVPDEIPFDVPYGLPISLDRAQPVIHAAVAEAKKRNWKFDLAVADSAGPTRIFEDGILLDGIIAARGGIPLMIRE
jgi:glc operon protein GlcG